MGVLSDLGKVDLFRNKFYKRYVGVDVPIPWRYSLTFGTVGRVWLTELTIPWKMEVDQLIYEVGGTAAGNARMALYEMGPNEDEPDGGKLIVETDSSPQPGAYYCHIFDITPLVLNPGRYFIAVMGDDASGTWWGRRHVGADGGLYVYYFDNPGGYGAFADPCPNTVPANYGPDAFLRVRRNIVW